MDITIYSVKGFTSSLLKAKIEAGIRDLGIGVRMQEVHQVDQFLKEKLRSVPAIRVGEDIVVHPHDAPLEKTISTVLEKIARHMLKSLLVPIDFSEESLHALRYARMMAEHHHLGLTLVHIHQPVYDPVTAGALDVQLHQQIQEQLDNLVRQIQEDVRNRHITMAVEGFIEIGDTTSSLLELSGHQHFDMIIMSTRNADTFTRRLFGTVSSAVSRHSQIPVLVVPPEAEIRYPDKMVVGFTDDLLLNGSLDYILSLSAEQHTGLDFIHVTDDAQSFVQLKTKLNDRINSSGQLLSEVMINCIGENSHAVDEAIFDYAHTVQGGLVVLISHRHGFLETIGHPSVTQRALRHPRFPLLILHHHPETVHASAFS